MHAFQEDPDLSRGLSHDADPEGQRERGESATVDLHYSPALLTRPLGVLLQPLAGKLREEFVVVALRRGKLCEVLR